MSTFEVDRQSQAVSGLGRVGSRSGGGQEQKDDGLFGALMSGLDGADSAPLFGQEQADAAPEGGRSLFRREFLSSLFTGDALPAEDDAARLAAQAQQAEADAASGAQADADSRPVRHRSGARGEHAAQKALATGAEPERTRNADTADGASEPDGEEAPDAKAAVAPDGTGLRSAVELPPVPVPAPQPVADGAGEAAEDGPAGNGRGTAAEEALAGALAAGGEGDDPTGAIRITVISRETHFAPVKLGGGSEAPTFHLPGEEAPPAEREPQDEGVRDREAGGGAVDRASARLAQERTEARLAARQEQAGTAGEPDTAATGAADADVSGTGTTGTASGLQQGLTLSNLRQVSSAIGAELARMGNPAATAGQEMQRPAGGPLRLLDIQLHPADLGSITVRMRMGDAGLEVRLSAANPDTARMLRNDHAKLTDMLVAEGVEDARVSVVDAGDQGAAWTRFETLPRQTAMQFSNERGDDGGASDPETGSQDERKGHDEGEASSGGDRSGRSER
ncbi:MAG: flagellar hook-length control protein FliK [Pseudomonadota bacterium]